MSEIKLCKDCKHYAGSRGGLHFCGKRPCPVTGGAKDFADIERNGTGFCGLDAKYWAPKPRTAKPWWGFW